MADKTLPVTDRLPCCGDSNNDVFLARQPEEQSFETGEQRGEEACTAIGTGLAQGLDQLGREYHVAPACLKRAQPGARAVRRQVERWQTRTAILLEPEVFVR